MKLGTKLLMEGFGTLNSKAAKSSMGRQIGRDNAAHYLRGIRKATGRNRMAAHYLKLILNVMA